MQTSNSAEWHMILIAFIQVPTGEWKAVDTPFPIIQPTCVLHHGLLFLTIINHVSHKIYTVFTIIIRSYMQSVTFYFYQGMRMSSIVCN
jgi:hypothetical protein